ncbi:MAG: hypothetical protein IJX90_12370 [Blautia sp.]|nr:hypothetical protein [Blautia sp.]
MREKPIYGRRFCLWLAMICLLMPCMDLKRAEALVIKSGGSAAEAPAESSAAAFDEWKRQRAVADYGMLPIYARDVSEGTYPVEVVTSSVFFKIAEAVLTNTGDEMMADMTITSDSYAYVFMGTAEEAENAPEEEWISGTEEDERSTFHIPVEGLDMEFDCAAFSKKKQRWYDRRIVFRADSLPEEALKVLLPDYTLIRKAVAAYQPAEDEDESGNGLGTETPEPVEMTRADGEYSIEVNMTGGSGRASISSPTLLTIRQGKAYATLLWSSAHYDYMLLGSEKYLNETTDGGNSTFEIPITVLDEPIPVIADSTAMGDPLEIAYTLTFYEDSIGAKGEIPQEAAKKVLLLGVSVILAGGILNHFLKRRRKDR